MDEMPTQPPVTDHQRELATQAMNEFDRGQWNQCTTTMARLADARPTDVKVVLNRSVALFYQSGCKAIDELKHNILTVFNMARISPDLTESNNLDDADYAVVYYNKAVILFHEKQYRAALSILEKLYRYIASIDEALAQRVMLLLTELYLTVHQPYDAMRMVVNIEKSLSGKSQEKEKQELAGGLTIDQLKSKLLLIKIRCNLMAKLAKNKKECKSLQGSPATVNYVKAYYEVLRGNLKKASKILGNPPSNVQLNQITGECVSVMYYNNQAIINMAMGKPNTAICLMRDSLQCNDKVSKEADKGKPALQVSYVSQHLVLFYNVGILQLQCHRPSHAFECFIECLQVYPKNPRLWLRMAECCIMYLKEDNDMDRQHRAKRQVIQAAVGSGFHHKLILGQGINSDTNDVRKSPERGQPTLSLSFARYCLKNALSLLPQDPLDAKAPVQDDQGDAGPPPTDPVLVSAEPGNPLREGEVANLRSSVLAASSYVALCEDDYYMALSYSTNLLRQPKISAAQRYLGHMYRGEALVALDRIADAVDELNPDKVTDISTKLPEQPNETEKDQDPITQSRDLHVKWVPSTAVVGKALMQYNLAVAYAMRTEYDKASKALQHSMEKVGSPHPAQMFYLKIYLDLKQGNRKEAFDMINEHFAHMVQK